MVSLKVGRVERFFKMFFSKMFPCLHTFRCLLCILLHICRLYLNSLDEAVQFMIIKAGKALVPPFPPSCSSLWKGMQAKPLIKNWHIFLQFRYLSLILEITLRVLRKL